MNTKSLKYLIVGAGGCGASIGAFLLRAGGHVTFIARGEHLRQMRTAGLRMETSGQGIFTVSPVRAYTQEEYLAKLPQYPDAKPDVVFICVKGYSLAGIMPLLRALAHTDTIFIPILNIYGTGGRLQQELFPALVTDGCMYIAAEIKEPGVILQKGDIFRVVFGVRRPEEYRPVLETVRDDFAAAGIDAVLSENIQRDALIKFSLVSPMAACGAYYDVCMGEVQKPGKIRDTFAVMVEEIAAIGKAMGIEMPPDIVQRNLALIDDLRPDASASMQRDIWQGKPSEVDGIVFEVVRMAKGWHVSAPMYQKAAVKLGRL